MPTALATLAALGAAPPALGAAILAAPPPAAPIGLYTVEPNRTVIVFHIGFFGLFGVNGRFSDATGTLHLDLGRPSEMSLAVSVPVGSVHTASAAFADRLRSRAWLDAADFPDMRFRSTAVRLTGPGEATVEGELTLHGHTEPLTLHATLHGAGPDPASRHYVLGFSAEGHLRRSQFGIAPLLPLVGDDVRLTLDAVFERQS